MPSEPQSVPGSVTPLPSLSLIFRVWFSLGIQSFGGGTATLALIQRAIVDNYRWIPADEFTRLWAICQIAPGINLFALTLLLGRKSGGAMGAAAALAGLLFPSVTITILMTAGYVRIRHSAFINNALHGVLPATIGLGLVTALGIAKPLITSGKRDGRASLLFSIFIIIGSGAAVAWGHKPVILVLLGAGVLYAVFYWLRHEHRKRKESKA